MKKRLIILGIVALLVGGLCWVGEAAERTRVVSGGGGSGTGDMTKAVYDADNNSKVDANKVDDLSATYQPTHAALTSISGVTETNGGMLYGTADNAYAWLGAGTTGYFLKAQGAGAPIWSDTLTGLTFGGFSTTAGTAVASDVSGYLTQTYDNLIVPAGKNIRGGAMTYYVASGTTNATILTDVATPIALAGTEVSGTLIMDDGAGDKVFVLPTPLAGYNTILNACIAGVSLSVTTSGTSLYSNGTAVLDTTGVSLYATTVGEYISCWTIHDVAAGEYRWTCRKTDD